MFFEKAHVLTLLPRSVFQVFSSCRRGGDREKRDGIYNSFRSVISVCIHPNASHYLIATKAWQFQVDSGGLTCPDYEMGRISIGSQDPANRNQDDTNSAACACLHVFFNSWEGSARPSTTTWYQPYLIWQHVNEDGHIMRQGKWCEGRCGPSQNGSFFIIVILVLTLTTILYTTEIPSRCDDFNFDVVRRHFPLKACPLFTDSNVIVTRGADLVTWPGNRF